ncbi:hypothetical protein PG999_000303 [Apiospora kogelbergensis]|uniref:Heterokaryon incompatibility domain-containing protein n=1 Tax=Apiospora kogelbergensis TaxID=1337665 RepID=A0AAW0RB34_9PEZI
MASATSLLPYTYRPLPANAQTRIIELLPSLGSDSLTLTRKRNRESTGSGGDPLRCRLRDFDVRGNEDYEAVSYTWGEPRFTEELIVDEKYFLKTTRNFRDVLLRFRLPDRIRLLWVDAVCIDQKDDADKGRQIPRMAHIYSGASCVLVWLGDYPESAVSLRQVARFARHLHMLHVGGIDGQNTTQQSEGGTGELSRQITQALQSILELPWFGRLWVIQEVVLNPHVMMYCGSAQVSWTWFFHAIRSIETQASWSVLPSTVCNLWMRRALDGYDDGRFDTIRLLQDLSSAKCSDDRDRLWALSALARDLELETREGVHSCARFSDAPFQIPAQEMLGYKSPEEADLTNSKKIRLNVDYIQEPLPDQKACY